MYVILPCTLHLAGMCHSQLSSAPVCYGGYVVLLRQPPFCVLFDLNTDIQQVP